MKVIKRDDSIVEFDRSKIVAAIRKANGAVDEPYRLDEGSIEAIADSVAGKDRKRLLVEDIQDMVETKLMAAGKYELAKAYIIYRYTRALVRKANTTDAPASTSPTSAFSRSSCNRASSKSPHIAAAFTSPLTCSICAFNSVLRSKRRSASASKSSPRIASTPAFPAEKSLPSGISFFSALSRESTLPTRSSTG